jgi:integrase
LHGTAEAADPDLALFLRALDVTGARTSQLARCTVADLDATVGLLHVPRSGKGKPGVIKGAGTGFPIPAELAARIAAAADAETGLLFTRPLRRQRPGGVGVWEVVGRTGWNKDAYWRPFAAIAKSAEMPPGTSVYALRHSRIAALLLAGVPVRMVAAMLDTSSAMIERHYSRWIAAHDPAVALVRAALAREAA